MSEAAGGPRAGVPPALLEDSAEDLYEHAPCGYLSTLPDGLIVKVNETFLAWTGYRREDLLGRRRWQDLLTGGGRIFYETHIRPLLAMQGSVREIAVDIVRSDGSRLPALVNAVLRTDPDGTAAVVRSTVFDATDRREYERELLRARRAAEESEARARLLATTLQESLIPPALPRIAGVQVAGVYRPAGRGDEVGGDFYDVFEVGRGDWAVVVGDVLGKGARAAVVTGVARYTLRAGAIRSRRPRLALAAVNDALLRQAPEHFCTVVHGRLREDDAGFRLSVACGGHPLPLHATGGRPAVPVGTPGTVLGVVDRPALHDAEVLLRPGDVLLLYTDGVTEGRRDGEFFGEERLAAALTAHVAAGADAAAIAERLAAEVVAFQDGVPRDDIALVVLKIAAR